jgi:hypothetical protein
LIYKYFNGALLGQQPIPLFTNPMMNFTYWAFLWSGLNKFLFSQSFILIFIDILLFVSCIAMIAKPRWNYFAILFIAFIWLYQFLYYQILSYQPFGIGLLFAAIPFMFSSEKKYKLSFEACRYFLCGLYFLGGILKLKNGGIFQISHMSDSLKITVTDFMLQNPSSTKAVLISFLIHHEIISWTLYALVTFMELSFLIGFLTKKYDGLLIFLFFTFHLGNTLIMDIPFMNHFIIFIFLFPFALKQEKNYFKFESSPH